MVVQHNLPAMNSHRQLGINNSSTAKNLEKLSSGFQINRAGDDAAGLAISEKMRGQIRGLDMATQNAENGVSLIQTAEGALNETHSILQRMRELAVQSGNGTYHNKVDRENIDKEVQALKSEIERISTSTHYNNIKLLDGSMSDEAPSNGPLDANGTNKSNNIIIHYADGTTGSSDPAKVLQDAVPTAATGYYHVGDGTTGAMTFQIGANGSADQRVSFSVNNMGIANLGSKDAIIQSDPDTTKKQLASNKVVDVDVSTRNMANDSIKVLDDAINQVSETRAGLGAIQNRLEHSINNLGVAKENLQAAESSIRDVDMAKEMMEFTKNNILSQASQSMLAQANSLPQGVMNLLK